MSQWTKPELRAQSIYQIFPRNFTEAGTLDAAAEELRRVKAMGFDIVYLTPIHPIGRVARKGSVGSPYAIRDYRAVDPALGGEEALIRFADAAHGLGLKLIIDVVYNHTSPDSVLANERPDWFIKGPDGRPGRKVDDWSDVVDLDFKAPGLRDYLIETLEKWLRLGVDGFRCDVASLVPVDFWVEARRRAEAVKPTIWLAESVHKEFVSHMRSLGHYAACDAELYAAFDLLYDYDGREYFDRYIRGQARIGEYLHFLTLQASMLPGEAIKARCLENHDQERAAALIPHADRLRCWTAFEMLLPGSFFAYMGQEWALTKRSSLFEKDVIDRSLADRGFEAFFAAAQPTLKALRGRTRSFKAEEIGVGLVRVDIEAEGGKRYLGLFNLDGRRGRLDARELKLAGLGGVELLSAKPVAIGEALELSGEPLIIELA